MSTTDLSEALEFKSNERYADAKRMLSRLCNEGNDALACWHLAEMYEKGLGGDPDQETAGSLYSKSAELGDLWFKHSFGRYLERRNQSQAAFRATEELAKANYLPSIFRLGVYFENGFGVEKNVARGRELIDMAANSGHLFAKRYLVGKLLRGERGIVRIPLGVLALVGGLASTVRIGSQDPWDPRLVN